MTKDDLSDGRRACNDEFAFLDVQLLELVAFVSLPKM